MTEARQQDDEREPGEQAGPRRQCAGCGKRDDADDLLRVVLGPEGMLAVDLSTRNRSQFGRGAHVHPSKECVQKALKGGFAKVFKSKVEGTVESIGEQIVVLADRRIEGLLAGAHRGRLTIAGADSVCEAVREGKVALVVVATDAAAAVKHPEVQDAIAEGKAVAFSNKERLGAIFGRGETAVVAVLHEGVAKAIYTTRQQSLPFGAVAVVRSEAWRMSEDR